jgi:hypothetical protein
VFMSHFILSFYLVQSVYVTFYLIFLSRTRCLCHILSYLFISYKVFMSHFILSFYLVQGVYVTFYLIFLSRTRCSCHILCYIFYLVHGVHVTFGVSFYLGTDHLICRGELWFYVSFRNMFSDNTRVRIFIFPEFNIKLYDKTLNQIIFFPPPKSEYFFQQHWQSEYFFLEKNHNPPPPLQVKWSIP